MLKIGKLLRLGVFYLIAIPALAEVASKQPHNQFDLEKTTNVLSRLIEKEIKEKGVPSISIALVRNEEIVWKAAFGYANLRTRTPATPDTLYNAASTLKLAAATAIMQQVEEGKIKLHHAVNRYLGEMAIRDRLQSEQQVTFEHILSHWSGLTSLPGRGESAMRSIWSRELPMSLEKVVSELYSIRAPEVRFEYNNYGYALAGLLVEKISGNLYESYVTEKIFKPLGIKTADPFTPTPEMAEVMAIPYEVTKGVAKPAKQVHSDAYPAGNAYLTAEDMARFLGAHLNGGGFQGNRILSMSSVKEMHEPRFGGNYALGVRVKKGPGGNTLLRHTGRMPGMSSMMQGDVEAHVGVYYMANAQDVTSDIADLALALLRGESLPAERGSIQVEVEILDRYVGDYQLGKDIYTISRDGNKLFVQKNGNKKGELLAETPSSFFLKGDAATVTFDGNLAGRTDRMVIVERDWQFKIAKRTEPVDKR